MTRPTSKLSAWHFIDVLVGAGVVCLYFGLRYTDTIGWDFEQISDSAFGGRGSPTIGIFLALVILPAVGIHSFYVKKRLKGATNQGASGQDWMRQYSKSNAGALGLFLFLSFLLIVKVDPYLAHLISSTDESSTSAEVVNDYGQPELEAASDIQDFITPSYFASIKEGTERTKVGICKPLWDEIKAGRKTITLVRGKSFGTPILKVECD